MNRRALARQYQERHTRTVIGKRIEQEEADIGAGGFTAEGLAALGSLPLLDQPGERFRYNTGATVAGIFIERDTGAPFAEVLSGRTRRRGRPA